jgi:hypothetical protein
MKRSERDAKQALEKRRDIRCRRVRWDIAIIPQFGRRRAADNAKPFSRAPRDGLKRMTGRPS